MKIFAVAILCALSCSLLSAWGGPVYDVRTFGAEGDGTNDDTAAIQKALDASGQASGTVHFPAGIYLSKPLTLRTKTTLDFDQGAILQASPIQSDYLPGGGDWLKAKSSGRFIPFISGNNLEDIVIQGPGIIDGHGEVWWPEAEKARRKVSGYTLPRPNLIGLNRVKNLLIRDITLRNSPKFHLVPADCEGVVISNVTILAPEHAANTDAIDPSACNNVLITRCTIDVGDDNVAIKAGGHPRPGREFASQNIVVSNCIFKHGHGMSIGSETGGGLRNVLVTHCTFENTENGIRIKSQQGKGGLVEDIRYEHITMTNVDPAITFTSYYQNNSAKDVPGAEPFSPDPAPLAAGTPVYRDIHITDLTATCQRSAGLIMGMPSCCVSNVIFENVNITSATGFKISNASGIKLNQVSVKPLNGKAFLLANAQVDGLPAEQK